MLEEESEQDDSSRKSQLQIGIRGDREKQHDEMDVEGDERNVRTSRLAGRSTYQADIVFPTRPSLRLTMDRSSRSEKHSPRSLPSILSARSTSSTISTERRKRWINEPPATREGRLKS